MARSRVLVIAVMVVVLMATRPVTAGRAKRVLSFAIRALCIPKTESLLLEHDARRECAYDLSNNDRAVGVRYNLDDDIETRRSELSIVLADYEKAEYARLYNNGSDHAYDCSLFKIVPGTQPQALCIVEANSAASEAIGNIRKARAFSTEDTELVRFKSKTYAAIQKGVTNAFAYAGSAAIILTTGWI